MYACMYINTFVYMCQVYVFVHVCICASMQKCIYMHICRICAFIYANMQIYILNHYIVHDLFLSFTLLFLCMRASMMKSPRRMQWEESWVMSYARKRHVTHIDESWHTYRRVIESNRMSRSIHLAKCKMRRAPLLWRVSHVTNISDESCHTDGRVIEPSRIFRSNNLAKCNAKGLFAPQTVRSYDVCVWSGAVCCSIHCSVL